MKSVRQILLLMYGRSYKWFAVSPGRLCRRCIDHAESGLRIRPKSLHPDPRAADFDRRLVEITTPGLIASEYRNLNPVRGAAHDV